LTARQRRVFVGTWAVAAMMIAGFLFSLRWTSSEIAEARAAYGAMLDIEAAVGFVRRRGGAIDDPDAAELLAMYRRVLDGAGQASDRTLTRLHSDLPEIWRDTFLPSTRLYIAALEALDRDGVRQASLVQDDWFRWYNLHKGELNLPDAARRATTPSRP
jgi:hypothetical protein